MRISNPEKKLLAMIWKVHCVTVHLANCLHDDYRGMTDVRDRVRETMKQVMQRHKRWLSSALWLAADGGGRKVWELGVFNH